MPSHKNIGSLLLQSSVYFDLVRQPLFTTSVSKILKNISKVFKIFDHDVMDETLEDRVAGHYRVTFLYKALTVLLL